MNIEENPVVERARATDVDLPASAPLEVSVVMPCLNEAETLRTCVEKAHRGLEALGVLGEVIVADNGSTDGSREIAEQAGARLVHVPVRGYGHALRAGLHAARGTFVIMADSDDSYDFSELRAYYEKLREGFDLVIGNRFTGRIEPDAMPWKHKWIGNPGLTAVGRLLFGSPVGDFISGMRGMKKASFDQIGFRCPGMEFCVELIARCSLMNLKVTHVPTVLKKDGRSRSPHMRSWRDGWRILRFMLLLSPLWMYFIPGLLLVLGGIAANSIGGTLAIFLGVQSFFLGTFANLLTVREGLRPPSAVGERCLKALTSGFTVLAGAVLAAAGVAVLLTPGVAMKFGPAAVLGVSLGIEMMTMSFFFGLLRLHRNSEWF